MMNATESHGKNYMDLQAPTPPCQYISSKIINQGEQGHPVHSQAWSQIETGKKKRGGGRFQKSWSCVITPHTSILPPNWMFGTS